MIKTIYLIKENIPTERRMQPNTSGSDKSKGKSVYTGEDWGSYDAFNEYKQKKKREIIHCNIHQYNKGKHGN